jgi:hypothetical protein
MGRGRAALFAAAAWALAGAGRWEVPAAHRPAEGEASPRETVCELGRADRARTPSAQCLACHDGAAATGVGFAPRASNLPGLDHPVEVDYEAARLRSPRLRPRAALPREIVLVNGRITCTTCHDGAAQTRAHTVPQEQLCTSCHEL